jgi:hypothetical protein
MNEEELLRRYHADSQFSFGGLDKVKDSVDIKTDVLKDVLSKSDIYTEFRELKKPKYLPPVRTYGEDYLWEADLMFFTHPTFAQQNDGKLYIIALIDTFTKAVRMKSLKSKNTTEVTNAVKNLFKEIKPRYLRVDAGGEFISNAFTKISWFYFFEQIVNNIGHLCCIFGFQAFHLDCLCECVNDCEDIQFSIILLCKCWVCEKH